VKQLDPGNKPVTTFFKICLFDPTPRGQSSKFDQILPPNHFLPCRSDPASPMWTEIGTIKQLDHTNKLVKAFFEI
jgi:hypothetical protein